MSVHVIVVGGGIVGGAVALQCVERGASVTLVDAGFRGSSATRTSFAWLNANNKTPREYFELNRSGMEAYGELDDAFSDLVNTRRAGNTEWAVTELGIRLLRERVNRLREWGYAAELLPISELRSLEPAMTAPDSVSEFAWFPDEGYIDPVAFTERLHELAVDRGVSILSGATATRLSVAGGCVTAVELANGESMRGDQIVVCAGSASAELMATAGLSLPLTRSVGMVAQSAPGPVSLRSVHHDEQMHIRPARDGRIVMRHTDFDVSTDPGSDVAPHLLGELRDRVATVLPSVAALGFEWARVAVRPVPGDGYAVAGFWPGVEHLYVVVTHSGVTLGPLLGRLAAAEILEQRRTTELASFRPDRFAGASPM